MPMEKQIEFTFNKLCVKIPHLRINISYPRLNAKGAKILKFNFKRRKINIMLNDK